jgi:site-specific DNA recombinase
MTAATTAAAAIYCRISNDADGRMLGVTRQERSCRWLAAQRGLDVAKVFVDNDSSAFARASRPADQQLLAELTDGAFG